MRYQVLRVRYYRAIYLNYINKDVYVRTPKYIDKEYDLWMRTNKYIYIIYIRYNQTHIDFKCARLF